MRSEAGSSDDALAVRVQIIGRAGCHLCDEAEAVVAEVCGQRGVRYEVVSIDDDPALADEYAELIPVVLVDGERSCHELVSDLDRKQTAKPGLGF